jgi:hypothetical protein
MYPLKRSVVVYLGVLAILLGLLPLASAQDELSGDLTVSVVRGAMRRAPQPSSDGDARPAKPIRTVIEASRGADLLVHEATFADEEADRARDTGHSTAREAAAVAARAGARQLVLTHFSARYSRDASQLLSEAKEEFDSIVLARDGLEIDVPFQDDPVAEVSQRQGSQRG